MTDALAPHPRRARAPVRLILALAAANAVGFSGTTALPLWLAALPKAGRLSGSAAGALGSAEVLLIALSTMAASALAHRLPPRRLAVGAAGLALLGDLLCLMPGVAPLVVGRLLAGAATGALLSCATGIAARGEGAQKTLAWMQAGLMVFATAFYLLVPRLLPSLGPAAIFCGLAVMAALAGVLCLISFPDAPNEATGPAASAGSERFKLKAALALVAIAIAFVGQGAVWNAVVAIGQLRGFSVATVGSVMAVCAAVNIAGPLAGRALGERLGLAGPMLAAFAGLGGAALVAATAAGLPLFATGVVLLVLLPGFALPYAFAYLGRIGDDRFAAAGPAFLMLGSAGGPVAGAWLLGLGGPGLLGAVACGIVLLASCVLAGTALAGRRSSLAADAV